MLGSWVSRDGGGLVVEGRKPASSNGGTANPLPCECGHAAERSETQPSVSKVNSLGPLPGFVGKFSECGTLPGT